ncbi:GPO family capsid scaffolding protein [Brevundimonas sp. A19_0]|uniref:GPO family capsid scaffolding protein n=1 Tax=Brevundimonas sp. A19_0 TaxID=2821087 RepID=UPI001ADD0D28|nr:GPO family capsid scaffolding protein [Brevundimonas sp. A19_0]MBO9500771.1 GPO family capsid scaffolding protein [Brevundimonas sp. A19_0]
MSDTTALSTPKSKFFRVAVEGATASDGRTIERNWLLDIAASYNPATFGARVNMEHIKGFSAEGPFIAYGDVLAVKTEEVEIELAGKTEKRLALFAQIDPTDQLIKFNKARQKIYTSIEVEPNFAGTGKCYLMGLAVTDNPASLGTEALKFTAKADSEFAKELKATLDGRKQHATSLFSALIDTTIEFETAPNAATESALDKVLAKFSALLDGKKPEPTPPQQPQTPPADPSAAVVQGFTALVGDMAAAMKADREAMATQHRADMARLQSEFAGLKATIERTPSDDYTRRPDATGNNNEQVDF